MTDQDFGEEGQLPVVGDPRMAHDFYEAHPAFRVFV